MAQMYGEKSPQSESNVTGWIAAIAATITALVALASFLQRDLHVDVVVLGSFIMFTAFSVLCLKVFMWREVGCLWRSFAGLGFICFAFADYEAIHLLFSP